MVNHRYAAVKTIALTYALQIGANRQRSTSCAWTRWAQIVLTGNI